LSLVC